jgi:hypothetical protein
MPIPLKHSLPYIVILLTACALLCGCSSAPAVMPLTEAGKASSVNSPADNADPAHSPAAEQAEPTVPPLDQSSITSVIQSLMYAVENDDVDRLSELSADTVSYTMYIEGGDFQPNQRFLDDFAARSASNPTCEGVINVASTTYMVFFTGWNPAWAVTGTCYNGCYDYDTPFTSDSTGFVLMKNNGKYAIEYVFINQSSNYLKIIPNQTMLPCPSAKNYAEPSSSAANGQTTSCANAPQQQVKVGGNAKVCTQKDSVAVRSEPSRLGELVTRLATGSPLEIIGGPGCSDGFSWWQVRMLNGTTGWIAEGGDEKDPYFICPVE